MRVAVPKERPAWAHPLCVVTICAALGAVYVSETAKNDVPQPTSWGIHSINNQTIAASGPRVVRFDNATREVRSGMGYLDDRQVCLMVKMQGARIDCPAK